MLSARFARVSRAGLAPLRAVRSYASDSVPAKKFPEPAPPSQIEPPTPQELQQAPNRKEPWAPSQNPRSELMYGPRWEQRDPALQPAPLAAIELIKKEPVKYLHDSIAVCDGGRGAQGHPKIYINLDKPGTHACLYCGNRFAKEEFKEAIDKGEVKEYIG